MKATSDSEDSQFVHIHSGSGQGQIEYRFWPPDAVPRNPSIPTLTLLHEGLGCVALWRDFPTRLAELTNLPVLAYSRFGYGQSSPVSLPRPLSYMHDEAQQHLPALLDALDIQKTVLIGHSDGASIAAIHAGLADNTRIDSIILISPHFFCEEKSLNSIRNARIQWQTGMLRTQLARYHGDNVDCAFEGWNGAWLSPAFKDWNIETDLASVSVPVLGIQRSEDPYGSDRQLQVIVDSAPKNQVTNRDIHFIDGTGHAPHLEQTGRTLKLITDFLIKTGAM